MKYSLFYLFFLTFNLYSNPTVSWQFDEKGDGSYPYRVIDSISSKVGTAYNAPNVTGKICGALDLTKSSIEDYVILDASSLDNMGDFTVSIWHKGTLGNDSNSLLSGATAGSSYNEFIFWFSSATNFVGHLNNAALGSIYPPNISDGMWHHLVLRRQGSQICLFTDGINRGCLDKTNAILQIDALVLGQEQDRTEAGFDVNQDWEGIVDELLIYREALSDTEILNLYDNQNAGKNWDGTIRTCTNTVAPKLSVDYGYSDWHFDESSWNSTTGEVKDSHGTNSGKAFNVTSVAGKICQAMDLSISSASDYAILGKNALSGVDDFTVSVWNKSSSNDSRALLSGARVGNDNELFYWFSRSTSFNSARKGRTQLRVSVSNIADNSWHHLVWQHKNSVSCLFIDGTLNGCQPREKSGRLIVESLILGQDQDNVGAGFDANQDWEGVLDELIIFRRALSSSEISSIYNNQNAGKNWDGTQRVCPNMPQMQLTKTSIVVSDPLNGTNNPKRIPGSIVEYQLEAKNLNTIAGENIVINDDLTKEIDTLSEFNWQGNIRVTSPNINGGLEMTLTDTSGDDDGEFQNNIVTVRCGDISNTAPCLVKYEIEIK